MNNCGLIFLIISTIVGIYIGFLTQRSVSSLCEAAKCPYCYGIDLCQDIDDERITLKYESFNDICYNLFSVKNVFFAYYDGEEVVLKKLGHQSDLNEITRPDSITEDVVLEFVISGGVNSLKTCNREVAKRFLSSLTPRFRLEEIWTIIRVNPEPLILSIFDDASFPVPKFYGSCGLVIVEKYCGLPLNYFQASSWNVRTFLASQLLKAAIDFTQKHDDFRMYLTDISPDNIAVDENFNLYFIDLENIILQQKLEDNKTHYSDYFSDEDFVYSEEEVCRSSRSDHNIYAVCRLLLSRRAPWPMMTNGLLHTPSSGLNVQKILTLVEECVDSKRSRFEIAQDLVILLNGFSQ